MSRRLRYYGDPILRKKVAPVGEVTQEIKDLVEEMDELMLRYHGVGLAAPQVGEDVRLFIFRDEYQDEEGKWCYGPLEVYINPALFDPSEEFVEMNEGCLSIPGIRGDVVRPASIRVEATDVEGRRFSKRVEGIRARGVMHENDHLNGVLWIDRISKKERKKIEPHLRKLKK